MPCHRCHSLMFPIDLLDEAGGLVHQRAVAWRCFACGDIIDPVISENRGWTQHGGPEQSDRLPELRTPTGAAY